MAHGAWPFFTLEYIHPSPCRPPLENIGERACVNGNRCIAQFIAQIRYGPGTDMAFTCKEFLLPEQHKTFLAGGGLPHRRSKCLLCARYFLTYTYILVRAPF